MLFATVYLCICFFLVVRSVGMSVAHAASGPLLLQSLVSLCYQLSYGLMVTLLVSWACSTSACAACACWCLSLYVRGVCMCGGLSVHHSSHNCWVVLQPHESHGVLLYAFIKFVSPCLSPAHRLGGWLYLVGSASGRFLVLFSMPQHSSADVQCVMLIILRQKSWHPTPIALPRRG